MDKKRIKKQQQNRNDKCTVVLPYSLRLTFFNALSCDPDYKLKTKYKIFVHFQYLVTYLFQN